MNLSLVWLKKKRCKHFLLKWVFFVLVNLSALVYEYTLPSLALPIKLVLPTVDIAEDYCPTITQQLETHRMAIENLLEKGAGKRKSKINNYSLLFFL
jgi:hypothetical protein